MSEQRQVIPVPVDLAPKRPPLWAKWDLQPRVGPLADTEAMRDTWRRGRLLVLSSIVYASFRGEMMWQYLVSVSARRQRATDDEVERVLRDFDLAGADEDNHEPGIARKWWRPCSWKPGDLTVCECKETEASIVEPDGFTWQAPKETDPARARDEAEAFRRTARVTGTVPL